jgi:hypothetical protein
MRMIPLMTAAALVLAVAIPAHAAPLSPSGLKTEPAIVLAQAKKKEETVTQKVTRSVKDTTRKATDSVKRTWKKLTGYHFNVSCLTQRTTCSETGKSQGDAQAKCIARHPACWVEEKK